MSEADKAIVRACLDQMTIAMAEARMIRAWWELLPEAHRLEWKVFAASVTAYGRELTP
ncbi:MAG: hypothetical protein MUQ56_00250 [Thermoleophilia bacterium]|nr:hypothetical protein [Thermoleophilia bacterium]